MYASALLSSASDSMPQTLPMRVSLGTMPPRLAMSRRSTSNSLGDRRTDFSPHLRVWVVSSSRRSSKVSSSRTTSP